jgi:hypothetical protein
MNNNSMLNGGIEKNKAKKKAQTHGTRLGSLGHLDLL